MYTSRSLVKIKRSLEYDFNAAKYAEQNFRQRSSVVETEKHVFLQCQATSASRQQYWAKMSTTIDKHQAGTTPPKHMAAKDLSHI